MFETDPSTHLNRILNDTFADGVVLRRLEASLLTRQPFQDRATTSSRRPCAFRGFLLERTPNSMVSIADGLAKIAGPGATVRGVQDIGVAPVAVYVRVRPWGQELTRAGRSRNSIACGTPDGGI